MKRIIPVRIILLAAGGYFAWSRMKVDDDGLLRLSGNIEFQNGDIAFKPAGRLIELNVDEGASVAEYSLSTTGSDVRHNSVAARARISSERVPSKAASRCVRSAVASA